MSTQVINVYASQAAEVKVPEAISAVGHMVAMRSVNLSFDVDGHLVKILSQDGHRVKQGDVIAELNDQSDLAQLTSLQADLSLQKSTYQRMLKIKDFGGISKQTLDQAQAKVVKAQAAVKQQQIVINQKKLKAPFDGILGTFDVDIGAYIAAGTGVVRLVQEAPLRVRYSVPASERSKLEIGQTVTVSSSAYPKKTFSGILSYISPQVNQGTGTITLEAKVDNPDYLLLPGMFVSVKQIVDPSRQLLMIPDVAVLSDIEGQYVYQVINHNSVKKVYVKTGLIERSLTAISTGLKTGDMVVTAGQQKLQDGATIKILDTKLILPQKKSATVDKKTTAKNTATEHKKPAHEQKNH